VAQACGAQPDLCALRRAVGDLPVEHERDPFGVSKIFGCFLLLEFEEGIGCAVEF
jgi:hypothetical protein